MKLLDFITPPVCPLCEEHIFLNGDGSLCRKCEASMPELPERCCPGCGGPNFGPLELCPECGKQGQVRPWQMAVSAFPFHGNARRAIHNYKFRGKIALAPYLGQKMWEAWVSKVDDVHIDVITYIPLFFTRYIRRGYNQSAMLAEQLSRYLNIPAKRLLLRRKNTAQQARLNKEKRLENMRDAFKLFMPSRSKDKSILLVDDVFTTGATLTAAANVLLEAGAMQVSVITIARD